MNLTLKNDEYLESGIFGNIYDETDRLLYATLQHAYDSGNGDGSYLPKIPPGVYKCVRGQHQLHNMTHPFETFEITGVPGHTNLLFHQGNTNKNSEGCILLGSHRVNDTIVMSALAFESFMKLQNGINQFTLTVTN